MRISILKPKRKCGQLWPSKEDGWDHISPCDFFTIDPGMSGTGWALWERQNFFQLCPPLASGVLNLKSTNEEGEELPWYDGVQDLASRIVHSLPKQFKYRSTGLFYVEEPTFMEGGKGMVTARSGALVKLISLYGAILGASLPMNFVPVQIADWKGQCSKEIIKHRIMKRLPKWKPTTGTTHEMDAVGIGLYLKGYL